jgi:hypothetical protein
MERSAGRKDWNFKTLSILDRLTTGQAWLCNEKSPDKAEFRPF